jgi:hypothetical protein
MKRKKKKKKRKNSFHFLLESGVDLLSILSKSIPFVQVVIGSAADGKSCTSSLECR